MRSTPLGVCFVGTAGPIAGKRIGVEPKVWRSVPLCWRSVVVKRIKQELKMWANMWQQGADNTVEKSSDNTQITPSSCSPLQRHTLIPHLAHCCCWLIVFTMTSYRHTYSLLFLSSYKAICPPCIWNIFAWCQWIRTSGLTYFWEIALSSNSYWPVSVVYFLAFHFGPVCF